MRHKCNSGNRVGPVSNPHDTPLGSLALVLLLGLLGSGCGSVVAVREIDTAEWFQRANRNALGSGELSERTDRRLRLLNLRELYEKDHELAYNRAMEWFVTERNRNGAFILAEICYLEGQRAGELEDQLRFYLSAAQFAWAFLFDPALEPEASSFDPAYRWCCDLYNRSAGRFIEVGRELEIMAGERTEAVVRSLAGDVHLAFGVLELHWDRGEHEAFLVAYNYEVTGLPQLTRTYGLGVPLIAVRNPEEFQERDLDERFLPKFRLAYPVTGLIRFQGSLLQAMRGDGAQDALLECYDPLRVQTIPIAGGNVPLEADLTTPLAFMFKEAEVGGFSAMLNSDEWTDRAGLYMLHPYMEDRIPVILVHGLMSSPLTWLPLFNEMLSDPVLRDRYQFWFFMYPTGNPVLYSASILRETLHTLEQTYDPERTNPRFQNMVLVGHSMGGLVSKLQVFDSGDRLWNMISDEPFEEVDLPEDSREVIQKLAFFERLPFVQRLVLMATPHRGSILATRWYGKLGALFITTSFRAQKAGQDIKNMVMKRMKGVLPESMRSSSFDGITNLAPKSQLLKLTSQWEFPADLPVHSIVGNEDGTAPEGSDGVVDYESAHLDGVTSELVVHSEHNVHTRSDAILELRRILLLHLEESGSALEPPAEQRATQGAR